MLITGFNLLSVPSYAANDKITYAGSPIDFVEWKPAKPSYQFDDVAPAKSRQNKLLSEETATYHSSYHSDVYFHANGDVQETILFSRYYTSNVGIQEHGNLSFWIDAFSQKAVIEQAYTLLPNGNRVDLDPATIQLALDSYDDIFTDSFDVTLPYPALERGAVAVLKITISNPAANRALQWSKTYYPQLFVPQEKFAVTLRWEDGQEEPQWKTDSPDLRCIQPETNAIKCTAGKKLPYEGDPDIRYQDTLPALIVSQDPSWSGIIEKYMVYFQSKLSANEDINAALSELLQNSQSPEETLQRIHKFVSQKIRYVGLEKGLGGVIPRPSALTLKRRYGDCKDKTALFIDMARSAGLDAYPVLTSTDRLSKNKLLLPAPHYFNHMVACVKLSEQKEYCVDLTDPYSSYKLSSYALRGAIRLDLLDGTNSITNFEGASYFRNKEVKTVNTIRQDGSIEENQSMSYTGPNGTRIRGYSLGKTQKERLKDFKESYHRHVSNSVDPTFKISGLDSVEKPVTVQSTAHYLDAFSARESTSYSEEDGWLENELSIAKTENKNHDYLFSGARLKSEYVNVIPKGYRITFTGPDLKFESEFGSLHRRYEVADGEFRVTSELLLPRATIPLSKIPKFNRYLGYLEQNTKMWVELKKREN